MTVAARTSREDAPTISSNRRWIRGFRWLLAAAALVACSDKKEPASDETANVGAQEPKPRFTEADKVALMERHYVAAITAHDLVIRNDLGGFRQQMAELSEQELPPAAPDTWRARHEQMRALASKAKDAPDLAGAAANMGQVAESCGECHLTSAKGPVYRKPDPQAGTNPLEVTMHKHQWATERLWEGVTGPWDDAWLRATEAITETELFSEAGAATPALRDLEKELRALGDEAKRATTLSERAAFYGRFLAACASCHEQAKVTLKNR